MTPSSSSAPVLGTAPARLRFRAYAKINLDLRIGLRRPDGFHDLTTVMQSLALHDTVTIRAIDGPCRVRCGGLGVPQGRDNLVWRAAQSLWTALGYFGEPRGADVTLTKRIPVQAGLGGGTSDAVSALRGLCQLWQVSPSPQLLHQVAAQLGADGPFFLVGGTALGMGRGDEVYSLCEADHYWVVIVVPTRGVSTARAYDWLDRDVALVERGGRSAARDHRVSPVVGGRLNLASLTNDLEKSVVRRRREIRKATRALAEAGALTAAMTGSGSAVFGLFASRTQAAVASNVVRQFGERVIVTRTLSRDQFACRFWL